MTKITADDIRKITARYLAGAEPVDIGKSFGTDGSNIRYHLAKSSNLWVLKKLHAEVTQKARNATAVVSKNKWNAAAEVYAERIASVQASHKNQQATD